MVSFSSDLYSELQWFCHYQFQQLERDQKKEVGWEEWEGGNIAGLYEVGEEREREREEKKKKLKNSYRRRCRVCVGGGVVFSVMLRSLSRFCIPHWYNNHLSLSFNSLFSLSLFFAFLCSFFPLLLSWLRFCLIAKKNPKIFVPIRSSWWWKRVDFGC